MRKDKLLQIPVKEIKPWHNTETSDKKYKLISEIQTINEEKILINTFYDVNCVPILRVFISDNRFMTYCITPYSKNRYTKFDANKWYESTLEKILEMPYSWQQNYEGSYYSDRLIAFDTKTLNQVKRFMKSKNSTPGAMILNYQLKIREDALKKKYRDKEESKKMYFKQLKELPKDFRKWVDNVAFHNSKYIFYKRTKDTIEGYCTSCQTTVSFEAKKGQTKPGSKMKCPHCKKLVELKPKGIYKSYPRTNIRDWSSFAYIHKIENGIAVRCFNAYMDYYDVYNPTLFYEEEARYFIKPEAQTMFIWQKGKDEKLQWGWTFVKVNGFYAIRDYYLYTRDLKKELKGTEYQYSKLWELGKKVSNFNVIDFLKKYEHYPKQIESLIINKFYYYTAEGIDKSSCFNGKSIKEILGIENNDIKFAASMDMSKNEIEILKRLRKHKRPILKEDFVKCRELIEDSQLIESVGRLVRYTTLYKILKYSTEHLEVYQKAIKPNQGQERRPTIMNFLSDYRDYIMAADQLGWNMKSNSTLFPKDLKRSHDIAMKLIYRKAHQEERLVIRSQFEELVKKYSYEKFGLIIKVPKTAEEISLEGNALKHCVGSYVKSVAEGRCIILFIRKKDDIKKSFYTMEIRDGDIYQCRGLQNCNMTSEVKKFTEAFKRDILNKKQNKKVS